MIVVGEHTQPDQALAFSAAKKRQLRTCATKFRTQLDLPMFGLPSLRELVLYLDEATDNDDFVFNKDFLLRDPVVDFCLAFDDGKLDHLTSLRVRAKDGSLEPILFYAKESKPLYRNLKSLHCHRLWTIDDGNIPRESRLAAESVSDSVRLCPNLQELCLFGLLTYPRSYPRSYPWSYPKPKNLQLHPENKGLDKFILGDLDVRSDLFQELKGLVALISSVELGMDR